MKVSFVTVNYNKDIIQLLDCLNAQTHKEIELIIVNDNPLDKESYPLILEWSKTNPGLEIKQINNEKNSGNCSSRNIGVKACTGDIVFIQDSDCLFDSSFIEEHISAHKKYPVEIVIGLMNIESSKFPHSPISQQLSYYKTNISKAYEAAELQDNINTQSFLNCVTRNFSIKKSAITSDLFDETFNYSMDPDSGFGWEDIEMGYSLYKKGYQIKFIEQAITIHISHKPTVEDKIKVQKSIKNFKRLLDKHPELILVARRWVMSTFGNLSSWYKGATKLKTCEELVYLDKKISKYQPAPRVQVSRKLKVLTYRWHCPHQYELYKMPWDVTLVTGLGTRMCDKWEYQHRPLPSNATFKSIDEVNLKDYDLVILHLDENSLDSSHTNSVLTSSDGWGNSLKWLALNTPNIPKIALCHGTPQFYGQYTKNNIPNSDICLREKERLNLVNFLKDILVITNSYQAANEWGFHKSKTIWQGFDPTEYQVTNYNENVLTLGNSMKERPHYRGYFLYQEVMKYLNPSYISQMSSLDVKSPDLPLNTNDFAVEKYRNYRNAIREYSAYFNPTLRSPMPRSRGEAMMCGLSSISADNHDVNMFIKNGINGFYSNDPYELAEYLKYVISNKSAARAIGTESRKTALQIFNHDRFMYEWMNTIFEVIKA